MADIETLRAAAEAAKTALAAAPEDAALQDAAAAAEQALADAEREAAETTKPAKAKGKVQPVKVRLLVAYDGHAPDTVLSLSPEDADALAAQGVADADPAAVAYAESLR